MTRAAVLTRLGVAVRANKFAIGAVIIAGAHARVPVLLSRAHPTVLTRRAVAEIHLDLTVTTHVTRLAIAVIVVDQLYAILGARRGARIRQALVDIAFASRSDETGRTFALESAHLVGTGAVVMTGTYQAVVGVDVAYDTKSTERAGTIEAVDLIVTDATVLAGIWLAVVDIELAVLTLEALGT